MKKWFVDVEGQTLLLRGRDTIDLLQRISTNDVTPLSRGGTVTTVLTSEKGRIVGVMSVNEVSPPGILSATVWGKNDPRAADWIRKYVIMEDLEVVDESDAFTHVLCFAEGGDGGAIQMIPDIPSLDRARNHAERLGRNAWTRLAVRNADLAPVHKSLTAHHFERMDEDSFERTRIIAGIPSPQKELNESVNPLEAGLREYVNFRKGCYVGQEVIARLDSYRKVSRMLTRVRGEGAPPSVGPVEDASGECGNLTSSTAQSEIVWVGLAYLRERAFQGESQLLIAGTPVKVVDPLGFSKAYEAANV